MNPIKLKNHIFQNNLIVKILDNLGCKQIKYEQGNKIITASLPNGNNSRSVQVRNNTFLDATIRSKSINKIDIFDIVSYIYFGEEDKRGMKYSREMAINWVTKRLNIDYNSSSSSIEWALNVSKKINKNSLLKIENINKYFKHPHKIWIDEGINYETQLYFEVGYNIVDNQIIFPIYNDENELIGIKARNLNYKKNNDNPKYIYLNPFFVGGNLYGLNIAKNNIEKCNNSIIIFESEKSVMKAYQYGYKNCVALACKELTNIQVDLLKKYINDDTNIILAFDKDVYMKKNVLDITELKKVSNRFENNKVYCLIDKNNELKEKDAPIDCGKDLFKKLLDSKKRLK